LWVTDNIPENAWKTPKDLLERSSMPCVRGLGMARAPLYRFDFVTNVWLSTFLQHGTVGAFRLHHINTLWRLFHDTVCRWFFTEKCYKVLKSLHLIGKKAKLSVKITDKMLHEMLTRFTLSVIHVVYGKNISDGPKIME